jgi:hypothetical protein
LYFFCHAGEPNFILRPEVERLALVLVERLALVLVFVLVERRFAPELVTPTRPSAAREAGVIWLWPAKPPGGTINFIRDPLRGR